MYLNYRIIIKILGAVILILGVFMIPSIVASQTYAEQNTLFAFSVSSVFLVVTGAAITLRMRPHSITLRFREGYLTVTLCWLCASALGAAPYLLSGVASSFADAFFESVSGFTTTGCSVFDVENMPNSLVLWKAVSHLLGGMGILVFAISMLPALGIGGQKIFKAEAPGPTVDKVTSRISDSARVLYVTYLVFGAVEFMLLSFSPMGAFDALIHTMGSISTSGLTNHYEGVSYYGSSYVEYVIGMFTVLASINFVLYAHAIQGRWKEFFSNVELQAFLTIIVAASAVVSIALFAHGTYTSIFDAFRIGTFEVIAFATTSGQTIVDFTNWPVLCKSLLLALMFVGGCAASTCGSIKVVRILVMMKLISRGVAKRMHPRSIVAVKLGDKAVSAETVSHITSFILTYMIIFVFSCIVLSLQNLDFVTTVSTSASMLGNIGCNLGTAGAGPSDYSLFSGPLKLYMSLLMIVGRLELFAIIVLLSPRFWNPDR
ncbi:MAG: TrkH family potassium uptake protein [Clostridiales bacterium]|nr:TrkH family potassium uptake protein [Clostridiales bacterium]